MGTHEGALVGTLVDPLVGQISLSPALCVANLERKGFSFNLPSCMHASPMHKEGNLYHPNENKYISISRRFFDVRVLPYKYIYIYIYIYNFFFRNPCDRNPPKGNFKSFKFFRNSPKILNVHFWGDNVYFGGDNFYFWGNTKIWGLLEFPFFCCWGGFGALWVGGTRRGFQKYPALLYHSTDSFTLLPPWHETNAQIIRQEYFPVFARVRIQARHVFARMNSPKNLAQCSGNTSSKIVSCIRASANAVPACIRAKINSPRIFSCMSWFCAGGV